MPLLSNDYLKHFFFFLETASENDLRARHETLGRLVEQTPDREFKKTWRWLMRQINEEWLTRATLK